MAERAQPVLGTVATQSARALVILNPVAGRSTPDEIRHILDDTLGAHGWPYRLHETTGNDDFAALMDQAKQEGCELVVAAGGDGTVSLVGHSIIGSGMALGVLPVGTANVLARELGIPADVRQAAALLVEDHRVRALDVMQVGERHFILQIGIGLDSLMIRDTDREAKRTLGRLAYMKTLAAKLVGYRSRRFTLVVDGKRHRLRAWQVLVANAGTLGIPPFRWGPNIAPDDGELDLCVFNVRTPMDYGRLVWRLLTGRHKRGPNVRYFRIRQRAAIVADRPLPIQADGEIIGETPVQINVLPNAIKILTPLAEQPVSPISVAAEAAKDRT